MIGISSGVNKQCPHCELEHANITDREFQCFPGSPNQVTFRAKVHDRAQATAREVITYIEQWIISSDNMVTLPVHHARLNINNTCVVLLSSFDDPECPGYLTPPSQPASTTTSISTNDETAISKLTTAQPTMGILGSKGETLSPVDTKQPQLIPVDARAIVGGAVAVVLIITAGVVMILLFLLHSIFKLKYMQTTKQRY